MSNDYKSNYCEIGYVELFNHAGKKIDITKTFKKIEIDEDLFSSVLSGRLFMLESEDFHQNFPLIGEEVLRIKFKTPVHKDWIEIDFETFNIAEKTNVGDMTAYIVEFTSPEYLLSRSKRISKAYPSLSPEAIIEEVIKKELDSDKKITFNKTASNINFVATTIFPFELISSICSRSRGAKYSDFGFLFWESLDGFHFESIDEMINTEPLNYRMANLSGVGEVGDRLQVINSYVVEESFNVLDRMTTGAYGTEVVVFDPIKRTQVIKKFDYFNDSDYEKLNNMSGNSPKKRVNTSTFKYKSAERRMMMVDNGLRAEGKALRIARLNWIESGYRVRVEIPGNSEMRVGKTILLQWPSHTANDMNTISQDRYVSGKYLCTSMRHTIKSDNRYTNSCIWVKDSLESSPEEESEKTSKRMGMI